MYVSFTCFYNLRAFSSWKCFMKPADFMGLSVRNKFNFLKKNSPNFSCFLTNYPNKLTLSENNILNLNL